MLVWVHFSRAFSPNSSTSMAFGMDGLNDDIWRDGEKEKIP
jgi:hypothetical protein